MGEHRHPILGINLPGETRCMRTTYGGLCLRPGAAHIVWEGGLGSTACDDCAEFARHHRIYLQMHQLVGACSSPRGLWYPDEDTCRIPVGEQDYDRGQLVLP